MARTRKTSSAGSVEVEGLADFQKALRDMGKEWPRELRKGNKEVAEMLLPSAQAKTRGRGPMGAKAAPGLKAKAEQRFAKIGLGGARYPFALGVEFGAIHWPQFEPWRGSGNDAGYGLFPTIREKTKEIEDTMGDMLERVAKQAFPTGGGTSGAGPSF